MTYKLLVVDDNKDVVEVLEKRLLKEGYAVAVAHDGDEALIKLKEEKPDLILLDLLMPKVSGFEVLREIKRQREEEKDKWRPIMIISAKNEFDSVMKCFNLQADYYLRKPCSIDDILKAVKKLTSMVQASTK
jgi:DNA-binding response OmpR family regulator